jgi:hypothetical protein
MKKIMFNEHFGLQQSVLDGTKDMTRRICTLTLHRKLENGTMEVIEPDDMFIASDGTALFQLGRNGYRVPKENQPAYKVGEEIAIAQPYKVTAQQNREWLDLQLAANGQYIGELMDSGGWENKMFVSAYYCPNHIRIKRIKIERLQSISDEDCLREGVIKWTNCYIVTGIMEDRGRNNVCFDTPREAFAALIDRISGKGTWERNPWVYAYEFELVQ